MPRPRKPSSPFRYFNSSPEVIRLVVMICVRFPLSLRNVEDLLFERGIDIPLRSRTPSRRQDHLQRTSLRCPGGVAAACCLRSAHQSLISARRRRVRIRLTAPPRTPSTGLVCHVSAENRRGSAGFRAAIRNRGALRVPVFAPPGRVWRGPSPRGSTSVRFPCFADITGKIAKTRAKNREVKAD